MERSKWVYFGIGAAGGALLAAGLWAVFASALNQQIVTTLDTQLGPRVGAEIDTKLAAVGITRETGQQISRLLDAADNIGLIGLSGPGHLRNLRGYGVRIGRG